MVLNQNPERLNPQTLTALTTNRSHPLATALNSHAAALLTKEWAGQPDPSALTRLPRYRFIAQVTDRGELSRPFGLDGIRVEDVAERSAAGDGQPRGEAVARTAAPAVIEHQETLDERILAELKKRRRAGGAEVATPDEASGETAAGPLWAPDGEGDR